MMNSRLIRQVFLYGVLISARPIIAQSEKPFPLPKLPENNYQRHYDPQSGILEWEIPEGWANPDGSGYTVGGKFEDHLDAPDKDWEWEMEFYDPRNIKFTLPIVFRADDFGDERFPVWGGVRMGGGRNPAYFHFKLSESGKYSDYETTDEGEDKFEYIMQMEPSDGGRSFLHDCTFCEREGPLIVLFQEEEEYLPPEWEPMPYETVMGMPHVEVIVRPFPPRRFAWEPEPARGAVHLATWVTLQWRPSLYAVSHDVYLGDNFEMVNNGTWDSDTFRGNQGETFYIAGFPGFAYPEGLVPGTTYYWRIDEVNDAYPDSPWKGNVWSFSIPPKTAYHPDPNDGQTDVPPNGILSWKTGLGSVEYDVFFGTMFASVEEAIATSEPEPFGVYRGRVITNDYTVPEPLEYDMTYYWRVDAIDSSGNIYKGDVWSFTTEPFVYPFIEKIIATASSSEQGKGPENTVNGSGLDENGLLHGNESAGTMWLSNPGGDQPTWIQYEFDKVYTLHEMWVWNSNDIWESFIGFGCKDVTIEYSADGMDYTILGDHELARGPGTPDYAHNTTIYFGGTMVRYIRLTINSNWGFLNQFGLSEVRFLYIPARAIDPRSPL